MRFVRGAPIAVLLLLCVAHVALTKAAHCKDRLDGTNGLQHSGIPEQPVSSGFQLKSCLACVSKSGCSYCSGGGKIHCTSHPNTKSFWTHSAPKCGGQDDVDISGSRDACKAASYLTAFQNKREKAERAERSERSEAKRQAKVSFRDCTWRAGVLEDPVEGRCSLSPFPSYCRVVFDSSLNCSSSLTCSFSRFALPPSLPPHLDFTL